MGNSSIYENGAYLERTGGAWHLEDAPFKARQVVRMLQRHPELEPKTVCDVGCGAGGVLFELAQVINATCTGYEVSPQAHQISQQFASEHCRFIEGAAFADGQIYDLALALDVLEHVEDCFGFLRMMAHKARFKIYHVPLDCHVSAILRGVDSWERYGHLHQFTAETALKTIAHSGQRVIDWTFTNCAIESGSRRARTRFTNVFRIASGWASTKFAARVLGGYSILILAE